MCNQDMTKYKLLPKKSWFISIRRELANCLKYHASFWPLSDWATCTSTTSLVQHGNKKSRGNAILQDHVIHDFRMSV